MQDMHVVIDADQLIYSAGFAAKGEPLSHVLNLVKKGIAKIIEGSGAKTHQLYIGGSGNFREELTFDYKANRTADKPEYYAEIKQYMRDTHDAITVDGMETDDMVSVILYEDFVRYAGDKNLTTIILSSPDKDLKNTPGWHHNPRTDEVFWVTEEQAGRHFWYQMALGDSSDNIKGLPYCTDEMIFKYSLPKSARRGCGKATARKLLEQTTSVEEAKQAVTECYIAWGESEEWSDNQTYDYMNLQGKLLWMCRELDEVGDPIQFTLPRDEYDRQAERRRSEAYARLPEGA